MMSRKDYQNAADIVARLYVEDKEKAIFKGIALNQATVRWAPRALLAENVFIEFFRKSEGFDEKRFRTACRKLLLG